MNEKFPQSVVEALRNILRKRHPYQKCFPKYRNLSIIGYHPSIVFSYYAIAFSQNLLQDLNNVF